MKRVMLFLFPVTVLLFPLTFFAAESNQSPNQHEITITGVVGSEDATPLKNQDVCLYKAKSSGYIVEVGEGGVILNPMTKTDEKGFFQLKFKESFLPEDRTVTLTVTYWSRPLPLSDGNGVPVLLKIAKGTKHLDLNKLFGTIKVLRH